MVVLDKLNERTKSDQQPRPILQRLKYLDDLKSKFPDLSENIEFIQGQIVNLERKIQIQKTEQSQFEGDYLEFYKYSIKCK